MKEHIFLAPCPLPPTVQAVIKRLENAGFEAYAVGGCVRDVLLGLQPADFDIATNALPTQTATVFADCRVIETGIQHGTVTVLYHGQSFEITTYRLDSIYQDNRHPSDVTFTRSLFEDVKRRDFTICAMAWHPESGIHDFFGGVDDLQNGVLHCVGDPHTRFSEDALRILRAVRFCATYGFVPTDDLQKAAVALANNLHTISAERIRTEIFKALCGKKVAQTFDTFAQVWQTVLPEADFTPPTRKLLTALPATPLLRLAAVLQTADAASVLGRLKTDNHTTAQLVSLLSCIHALSPTTDEVTLTKALHVYGQDTLQRAVTFCIAKATVSRQNADAFLQTDAALEALLAKIPCYTRENLAVNGEDIVAMGVHGKAIGETLQQLLFAVMEQRCANEKDTLLRFLQSL